MATAHSAELEKKLNMSLDDLSSSATGGHNNGGGGGGKQTRPGDWTCPACSANCFASRSECFKCGASKPGGGFHSNYQQKTGGKHPDDWMCMACGAHCFASRDTCFKCNAPKGGGGGGGGGGANASNASVFERLGAKKGEGWRKHLQTYTDPTDGASVTQFYETEVVRVTAKDIILDCGGARTKETLAAMNDALTPYLWRVYEKGGEWFASSTMRLARFDEDSIVLPAAAKDLRNPTGAASAAAVSSPGPMRVVKAAGKGGGKGGGGARFKPY